MEPQLPEQADPLPKLEENPAEPEIATEVEPTIREEVKPIATKQPVKTVQKSERRPDAKKVESSVKAKSEPVAPVEATSSNAEKDVQQKQIFNSETTQRLQKEPTSEAETTLVSNIFLPAEVARPLEVSVEEVVEAAEPKLTSPLSLEHAHKGLLFVSFHFILILKFPLLSASCFLLIKTFFIIHFEVKNCQKLTMFLFIRL